MFGAGAPCALHEIVASFPSKAVKFWGGFTMTGDDAIKKWDIIESSYQISLQNNII